MKVFCFFSSEKKILLFPYVKEAKRLLFLALRPAARLERFQPDWNEDKGAENKIDGLIDVIRKQQPGITDAALQQIDKVPAAHNRTPAQWMSDSLTHQAGASGAR